MNDPMNYGTLPLILEKSLFVDIFVLNLPYSGWNKKMGEDTEAINKR